jgi:small-conductance mechanosensitive channel
LLAEAYSALDSIPYFFELVLTLVVWVAALVFVRYNKRLLQRLNDEMARVNVEDRSLKAIDQMFDLFTILVAAFLTLYIWGVDEMIYAALTTIGVVGVMLAFAIKDIASNFISGILLIMSKDLLVGDAIEVNGIEGNIERIAIRTTSVRRYDGALVLVPNSLLLNHPVVDFHATDKRRVEVLVVLPSTVDIRTATEALRKAGEEQTRRLEGEPVAVLVTGFEASIVKLELRFWVMRKDLTDAKSDVHASIQKNLKERGIVLDVPSSVEIIGGGAGQLGIPTTKF